MPRLLPFVGAAITALAVAGCSSDDEPSSASPAPQATETARAPARPGGVEGTVVRFSTGDTSVDVTLGQDHATARDFLSRLPMTVRLEDLSGREKIAYLEPGLDTDGAPGSDPEDGDLIYFKPWGNLGFYHDAGGIGYSDDTINLGTYRASEAQLSRLENTDVTVELVD